MMVFITNFLLYLIHEKVNYPCKQPKELDNCSVVIIPDDECKNQTFEWMKRNDSDRILDDGVRYTVNCSFTYNCSEGSCVTNNDETCLEDEESPIFKCGSNGDSNQLSTISPSDQNISETDQPNSDFAEQIPSTLPDDEQKFGWASNYISIADVRVEKGMYNNC